MTGLAYIIFVLCSSVLGALLGIAAHFWRANATTYPEKLFDDGDFANELFIENYMFDKHVVGAEWDDSGFWASDSVRNLLYYMFSGAAAPLLAGMVFWGQRLEIVEATCRFLKWAGLASPLC